MSMLQRVHVRLAQGASDIAVAEEINLHFTCPTCGAARHWHQTERTRARENSVIGTFACTQCHEQIVAKVPLIPGTSLPDRIHAQGEYRVLDELLRRFPQDENYGTLVPLGHVDASGIVITRKFAGRDLKQYVVGARGTVPEQLLHAAGRWLRKLHDACPRGYTNLAPDADSKTDYLERTYGRALRGNREVSAIYAHLIQQAAAVQATTLRASWSHGDYKPENVLHDGHKCVGIDTQLEHYSVFAYDLASFLNHVMMAGPNPAGRHGQQFYARAKEQVIAGYGDINAAEHRTILWAQLYFMLCYWGRYQTRKGLSSIYNHWRILPLLKLFNSQL